MRFLTDGILTTMFRYALLVALITFAVIGFLIVFYYLVYVPYTYAWIRDYMTS